MSPEEREVHWDALKLPVGHCSVTMDMVFSSSLRYWQSGEVARTKEWTLNEPGDLTVERDYPNEASILVHGDCRANLSVTGGALVHIQGDLASILKVGDHSEIVIGGDIRPGAEIQIDGIGSIFVGVDLKGSVRSTRMLTLCIYGSMLGTLYTGRPCTRIAVRGDFAGQMQPLQEAALVFLEVKRFMPFKSLEAIARHGYTQFDAAIGISDRPPGIYPELAEYKRLKAMRKYCSWIIHAQGLDT
jgi:hypothetical protein